MSGPATVIVMNAAGPGKGSSPASSATAPPATLGAALARVVEAIADEHGSRFMEQLDELPPGQRAVAVLEYGIRMTYADGLQSVYLYMAGVEDIGDELVRAAEHVGAAAYADLFRRAREAVPAAVRGDPGLREAYILDNEGVLDPFDDSFMALEASGDVLIVRVVEYVDSHPDEFAT